MSEKNNRLEIGCTAIILLVVVCALSLYLIFAAIRRAYPVQTEARLYVPIADNDGWKVIVKLPDNRFKELDVARWINQENGFVLLICIDGAEYITNAKNVVLMHRQPNQNGDSKDGKKVSVQGDD